ncbi:MAG: imidazole glycerol phosphate synthase subunit HisH [Nanoarchaeota archaeon]|nr:imidazole glycerol phosphate synthase subunit HisH [Nanoarchaeota archaeon]
MIAIIDYGGGNTGSVKNALDCLKLGSKITSDPADITKADRIILPGQGRFSDVMANLKAGKLDRVIKSEIRKGKPYLGICVGLQILFDEGEEDPGTKGLGIIKGTVPRFTSQKVPQIGWNDIRLMKKSRLFAGVPKSAFFYFVHSYYALPEDSSLISAMTGYGIEFASAVEKDNIYAVQFHPEKSGEDGLRLLKNFGDIRC